MRITVSCSNIKKNLDYGYEHEIFFDTQHIPYIISRYGLGSLELKERSDRLFFSKHEIRNPNDLAFSILVDGDVDTISDFLKNPIESDLIEDGILINRLG